MSVSKGRRYAPEFIQEAVRLVRDSGKPRSQIAQDLGVSEESLRRWHLSYGDDGRRRTSPSTAEHAEIQRLKRELRVANEEREILKKAAAFFAREGSRSR